MKQYLDALKYILENGVECDDRTGVGTISVFGYQMRFDLSKGFPAVTTKKLAWKAVVGELLWFLEGSDDERRLAEITFEKPRNELVGKKTIWTANADNQGKQLGHLNNDFIKKLGPIYGVQWRRWNGFDQIQRIIFDLKYNKNSRRIILSSWNVSDLPKMALPPCHTLAQFRVLNNKLHCQLYQRSADMFLGVPFDIASYSLLMHILGQICDLEVGEFIWTGGDCHIYKNHIEQVKELLQREPFELPKLKMPKFETLDEVLLTKPSDYVLENYKYHPPIKAEMAV